MHAEFTSPRENDLAYLLRLTMKHKGIFLVWMTVAVVGAVSLTTTLVPSYRSESAVLVVSNSPQGLDGVQSRRMLSDELVTHATVITSPWFISRVIEHHQLENLATLRSASDSSIDVLCDAIEVIPPEDHMESRSSNIIQITCTLPDAHDTQVVLAAVVESYGRYLSESAKTLNQDSLTHLTARADHLKTQISEAEGEYRKFQENLPVSGTSEAAEIHLKSHLEELSARRTELEIALIEISNSLNHAIESEDVECIPELQLTSLTKAPEPLDPLQRQLEELLVTQKQLSRDFGASHPEIRSLNDQIQMVRRMLEDSGRSVSVSKTSQDQRLRDIYLSRLRGQRTQTEKSLAELNELIEQELKRRKELDLIRDQDSRLTSEISRLKEEHASILQHIRSLDLGQQLTIHGSEVLSPPKRGKKVAPNDVLIVAITTILAAGVFFVGVYLKDQVVGIALSES